MAGVSLIAQLAGQACNPRIAALAAAAQYDIAHVPEGNNPLSLLEPAARGDLEAQRRLAILGVLAMHMGVRDQLIPLAEALSYARLAAAQGTMEDRFRLAKFLALAATISGDPDFAAEALAWLELIADQGHEHAGTLLASLAGGEEAEVLVMAKGFHGDMVRFGVGAGASNEGVG